MRVECHLPRQQESTRDVRRPRNEINHNAEQLRGGLFGLFSIHQPYFGSKQLFFRIPGRRHMSDASNVATFEV